jgi:uncharacterized protein YegL
VATAKTTGKKKASKKKVSTALNVAFVIDMSGSMGRIRDAAVEGANTYIKELQDDEGADTTRLTFVAFDNLYEIWHKDEPIKNVPFVGDEYQPRGGTALYDAIGKTIAEMDAAGRKDEKHLVVILTDGFENASVEYPSGEVGRKMLADVIKAYEDRGNWTFVYLGANDANVKTTASALNIPVGNAAYYSASARSVKGMTAAVASASITRKYDAGASTMDFYNDASLSTDFRDEDDKDNS